MYCELFQLTEPPFRLTPDPQFLFASKQHARAKAYMESTIWLADGFVVITGDIGSGKTTLIESFFAELPDNIVLAHISQTQLSPVEFLQALLVEFGFKPFRKRKVELLVDAQGLHGRAVRAPARRSCSSSTRRRTCRARCSKRCACCPASSRRRRSCCASSSPANRSCSHKLDSPRLQQLTQRVRLRFHLGALSKRETHEYITHRLNIAGANGRTIFEPAACDIVFRYTGGVPRLINVLCDTALLCAFAEERTVVDEALVKAAVEELQWVEFSERLRAHERAQREHGPVREPSNGPMARLEVLYRDQLVGEYRIGPGKTIIGRTADNDVQIQSRFISRHHAQVVSDQTQLRPRGLEQHQRCVHPLAARQAPDARRRRRHPDRRAQAAVSRHARRAPQALVPGRRRRRDEPTMTMTMTRMTTTTADDEDDEDEMKKTSDEREG